MDKREKWNSFNRTERERKQTRYLSCGLGYGSLEEENDSPEDLVQRDLLGLPAFATLDDDDSAALLDAPGKGCEGARQQDRALVRWVQVFAEFGVAHSILVEAFHLHVKFYFHFFSALTPMYNRNNNSGIFLQVERAPIMLIYAHHVYREKESTKKKEKENKKMLSPRCRLSLS